MSKVKVKGTFGGKTRFAEVERGNLTVPALEEAFKKVFSLSSVQLKYKLSNGNVQGVYQDFHLEKALEDSAQSGAKYLTLEVTGAGGAPAASSTQSRPAQPKPAAVPAAVAAAPKASSNPSPTNRRLESAFGSEPEPAKPKAAAGGFCTNCGASIAGAKFCPECGTKQGGAAPAPAAASRPAATPTPAAPKPVSGNGCAACGGAIGLTSVAAMNTNWHKECFVCQQCRKSLLEEGFKNVNNLPMCGACYSNQFGLKCAACKKVIDSEYVQVAGQPFHRECYA